MNIGIILNSLDIFAWQKLTIEKIAQLSNCKISCLIISNVPSKRWSYVYGLLTKMDNKIYPISPYALEIKKLEVSKTLIIDGQKKDGQVSLGEKAMKQFIDLNVDLLINLNPLPINDNLASKLPLGIWETRIGGKKFGGFNEVINSETITKSTLVSLPNAAFGNKIIFETTGRTEQYSFNKNWDNIYWKFSSIIERSISKLAKGQETFFDNLKSLEEANREKIEKPSIVITIRAIFKQASKIINKFISKKKYFLQWYILLEIKGELKKYFPPKGHIWADPFLIEEEYNLLVFVEETDLETDLGYITLLEISKSTLEVINYQPKIIKKEYHLSYPCVFKIDDAYYMIPESADNETIQLYRATEFPLKWEFEKNIMEEVKAFDATPFFYNEKWWLFTNAVFNPGDSHSDELFLFFSDDILSDNWVPHPMNPIVSDVRKARPAGHLYFDQNNLIRPSQDGSVEYGYSIVLNKITKLTETEYQEEVINRIDPIPNSDILRRHTINHSENFSVMDALRNEQK